MSINKGYKIIKVAPQDVLFQLRSISNPEITKTIHLTSRMPQQMLPVDWALGVFIDDGPMSLYQSGAITFEKNDELVRDAYEAGVYFTEELDFKPAEENRNDVIFGILQEGNRTKIMDAIKEYGNDTVRDVAAVNCARLSQGVVSMLENIFKMQFVADGE